MQFKRRRGAGARARFQAGHMLKRLMPALGAKGIHLPVAPESVTQRRNVAISLADTDPGTDFSIGPWR